jgi:hypothetical protein
MRKRNNRGITKNSNRLGIPNLKNSRTKTMNRTVLERIK